MRTITAADVTALLQSLAGAYPGFQLVRKSSQSERCTTWGTVIYVPQDWATMTPVRQWIRLQHEAVHLFQFQTMGSTWAFALRYAWPSRRFKIEQPAYAAEFQAVADVYSVETLTARRTYYLELLSGRAYYWMTSEAEAARWVDIAMAAVQGV